MAFSVNQMNQMFGKPGVQTNTLARPSDADVAKIFGVSSTTSIVPQQPIQAQQPQQGVGNQFSFGNILGNTAAAFTGQNPLAMQQEIPKIADHVVGIGKGALSTINNIGQLGMAGGIANAAKHPEVMAKIPEALRTPTNDLQQEGFTAEQLGEFLVPGGVASKANKAAEVGIEATKLPGILKGALRIGAKSGIGALETGGVSALQQGGINDIVKQNAIIGGVVPGAGQLGEEILNAAPIKNFLTKSLPSNIMNRVINTQAKDFNFGKNPGLALADEGIKGNNLKALQKGIQTTKQSIGTEMSNLADKVTNSGVAAPVNAMQFLNKAAQDASKKLTTDAEQKLFNNVIDNLTSVRGVENGKVITTGERDLSQMSFSDLHKMQKDVGGMIKWNGAPEEKTVNKVLENLYSDIGSHLDETSRATVGDSFKELQRRYSNMLGAENSINKTAAQKMKQMATGAGKMLGIPVAYEGAKALSGGNEKVADAAGALAVLERVLGIPAVGSRLSSKLVQEGGEHALPEAIAQLYKFANLKTSKQK